MSRGAKLPLWGRKNEVSAPQWIAAWKSLACREGLLGGRREWRSSLQTPSVGCWAQRPRLCTPLSQQAIFFFAEKVFAPTHGNFNTGISSFLTYQSVFRAAHRRGVARLLDQQGVFGENAGLVILK